MDSNPALSAKFLQARITALSTNLIKRFENILAVALDETDINGNTVTPAHSETAMQQMQLEVESASLIKAAEDIMVLTRSLKELWLFGELHTIKSEKEEEEMAEKEKQLAEDAKIVRQGMDDFLKSYPHKRANLDETEQM